MDEHPPRYGEEEEGTRTGQSGLRHGVDCSVDIIYPHKSGNDSHSYVDGKPLSAGLPCFGWEHGEKIEPHDTKTAKDGEKMM